MMQTQIGWICLGIATGVLAGCQPQGTKFQVKDQRVPEQIGLRVESVGDFGRDGLLARQPHNLARAYLERGELSFRFFRLTNTSRETVELYPSLDNEVEGPVATLRQDFFAFCPRENYGCAVHLEGFPGYPHGKLITEYFSEFDLLGSEFRFDSGGVEKVDRDPSTDLPRSVRIRPGESAVWTIRLGLRSGSAFISSGALDPSLGNSGIFFMPSGENFDPATRVVRTEWLIGLRIEHSLRPKFLARNPKSDELNPVFVAPMRPSHTVYDKGARDLRFEFPPPQVARRINGLADQI